MKIFRQTILGILKRFKRNMTKVKNSQKIRNQMSDLILEGIWNLKEKEKKSPFPKIFRINY